MSTVSVELSESLHAAAGELARESGVTVWQFLASALAEKVAALAGPGGLAARPARRPGPTVTRRPRSHAAV